MSPSEVLSAGQAVKFSDILIAKLRKSDLPHAETQQVLENQAEELATNFLADVRKRVEAISSMIVRKVKVDRNRDPQAVLDATGRNQYKDKKVVASMPRVAGEEVEVCFFKLGRWISDADLEKEYELRGLEADHYAQAQVNIDDPSFADTYPNGSHWKDKDGNWCFLAFGRWVVERDVICDRGGGVWDDDWWFAGRRKSGSR
jgi:hypothetical protein